MSLALPHGLAGAGRVNPTAMSEAETALQPDLPAEPAGHLVETGPPVPEAGGILTINLAAIAANWQELGRRAMPSECAAVIKAEGYGCGIEPVARALKVAGCKTFFVADLFEARRVRVVAPDAAIYVLNGLLPGTVAAFPDIRARPVIGSLVELAEWDAFCSANQWHGGAALHVDTGMNRLGISADEAAALAPRIRAENHGITLLMSHLACAEQPEHPLNERQMKLFREAGVNPLGGCLPLLLQIPIFFALYSFFNSNIALRGQAFLWTNDLSSYDSIAHLPFTIPAFGDHISLFTITAVLTSFLISIYNMAMTPTQDNPALKYMPYIFPFMLLFIFNKLPSALTWYYTVSNLVTLGLQFVIQRYIIDHDKILAKIDEKRKAPKKQSKWQSRYQEMMESQKKVQELKNKTGKK